VAIDTVETPFGVARDVLGGSAVYFSFAASCFCPVRLVGAIGEDFPEEFRTLLAGRPIDLEGLEVVACGRSFRWRGSYQGRMDQAETLEVHQNVLEDYKPKIPPRFCDSRFVFLANCSPRTQLHVLEQVAPCEFVLADTMNLWIQTEREALLELMGRVDAIVLNDAEALQLSGQPNLLGASRWICEHGVRHCIIKKGEHGSVLRGPDGVFVLPGFPAERVMDPTGAGDAFAGGVMGYLAGQGRVDADALKRALAYGTITASFAIEDFSVGRLAQVTAQDVERRLKEYVACTHLPTPL